MIVRKSSVFPAPREEVFARLQKLETLQAVAKPYAAFEPVHEADTVWTCGSTSEYRLKLFGVIPFGTHRIHIVRFDPEAVSSREGNEHVPVWNHDITMIPLDSSHTKYTDQVEIQAGWKTLFIWLWANAFYAYRQRNWIRLLKSSQNDRETKAAA
ncbi:MAG: hypothetical protein K6A40_10075 [Solobacterium sp.]|nr:hypothetical protein [Solobacterium sp.]